MGIVSVLSSLALDFCQHILVKPRALWQICPLAGYTILPPLLQEREKVTDTCNITFIKKTAGSFPCQIIISTENYKLLTGIIICVPQLG